MSVTSGGLGFTRSLWRGHDFAKRVTSYAAINPTGRPYKATERVEDLPSRRAAVRWLLVRTGEEAGR